MFREYEDYFQGRSNKITEKVLYDPPKVSSGGEIKKIECVKHKYNSNKIIIIVNGQYNSPLEVKLGDYWAKFYQLAEKQQTENKKGFFDYFNSNSSNPICKKLGYQKSQILKYDGAVRIVPNVIIEIITDKKYSQRKNKSLKKA